MASLAAVAVSATASAPPRHTTCLQPPVHWTLGNESNRTNVSFWAAAAFTADSTAPAIMLGMGSGPAGHVTSTLLLELGDNGTCVWSGASAPLSEARTSGCAIRVGPAAVLFAGGHNNSQAYVGTVDEFVRSNTGVVTRSRTMQLPVGRELLGCAWAEATRVAVFAGGKPPHPPAPTGETTEIDVWHMDSDTWHTKQLSVERKKVEALTLGEMVLMSGGEIGHHPPSAAPSAPQPPSPPLGPLLAVAPRAHAARAQGYSSSVDILNTRTMSMSTSTLALARQYFAVAAAGGKAFFGGGFANDAAGATDSKMPLEGFRSSLVDIFDSKTQQWSTAHLSTNRSNLAATSVMDRWVLFGGGTRIPAPKPDVCGTSERSAVVDIYDTATNEWSVACLAEGRTTMNAATIGSTAVFFGDDGSTDLFTF